jgi:hypothetical protein
MGKIKSFLKNIVLPTMLATQIFGGQLKAQEEPRSGFSMGFTIRGEDIARSNKEKELETKYQSETITYEGNYSTALYYHDTKNVGKVKAVFKKLPDTTQKHLYKIFLCSPEDYDALCKKGQEGSRGFVRDQTMYLKDDETLSDQGLEHIVIHESAHVHERRIDEISGKDEKNENYKEYFDLKNSLHEKQLVSRFMALPEVSERFQKEADEIKAKMDSIKNLPPSHYLEKEWGAKMKKYGSPEETLRIREGFIWKNVAQERDVLSQKIEAERVELDSGLLEVQAMKKEYDAAVEAVMVAGDKEEDVIKLNSKTEQVNNFINAYRQKQIALNEKITAFNESTSELVAPRRGYVTPYAATSQMEDRAETASIVLNRPEVIKSILRSSDTKAAEMMRNKLELLQKHGFITLDTFKGLVE